MKDNVMSWHPEPVTGGEYEIWHAVEEENIWAVRSSPKLNFKDDVLFEFFGDPSDFEAKGCSVKGKSRSRFPSYYDFDTNYCNMWNVFNAVTQHFGSSYPDEAILSSSECKWAPKDPVKTCQKY